MKNKFSLDFKSRFVLSLGRLTYKILKRLGYQASSTPGRLMFALKKDILKNISSLKPILLVSGTNGKTSTVSFTVQFLKNQGFKVGTNASGANLKNGLLTTLALHYDKNDVFVLEIDEAALASCASALKCELLVLTNIFRDQLDRFGEMHQVLNLIKQGTEVLKPNFLLVNGDDPLLSYLDGPYFTFGQKREDESPLNCAKEKFQANMLEQKEHLAFLSTMLCPSCSHLLHYTHQTIDHLGAFTCPYCHYTAPELDYAFDEQRMAVTQHLRLEKGSFKKMLEAGEPYESISSVSHLEGTYNAYNICTAVAAADIFCERIVPKLKENCLDFPDYVYQKDHFSKLVKQVEALKPSFGRLERIPLSKNLSLCFLLVKNPAGFSQSLALLEKQKDVAAIVWGLNANAQDGKDVSWIWDVPFENFAFPQNIQQHYLIGERQLDLKLRLNYAYEKLNFSLEKELILWIEQLKQKSYSSPQSIYILCNYTLMLDTRAVLAKHFGFSSIWEKE